MVHRSKDGLSYKYYITPKNLQRASTPAYFPIDSDKEKLFDNIDLRCFETFLLRH
jgi:hypothetical protein